MLRRGYKPAQLFLLAWAAFLPGVAMFSVIAFGLLPKTFVTEYGVQIGSALEMLLLSIALGLSLCGPAQGEHPHRAGSQRTPGAQRHRPHRQLRTTMAQLGEANVQLREYSRRDPLTGTYNRRHFREVFEQRLQDVVDRGQPLALLLGDLDNFKQINDTYGHVAGDDCLRAVATCFNEVLAQYDGLVARFGGEEFVAVLPGTRRAAGVAGGRSAAAAHPAQPGAHRQADHPPEHQHRRAHGGGGSVEDAGRSTADRRRGAVPGKERRPQLRAAFGHGRLARDREPQGSATLACLQHRVRLSQGQPARAQQHEQVVQQVGGFAEQRRIVLRHRGQRGFDAFLADLLRDRRARRLRTAAWCSCPAGRSLFALATSAIELARARRRARRRSSCRVPRWQVGPRGRACTSSVSPSQSASIATSARRCPDVSPLIHSRCRLRLKNVTRPLSSVACSAARSM